MLDGINSKLKRGLDVTLWKNSAAVISLFQSTEMKESCSFTSFNIIKFYPSISEDLLQGAILFTKRHVESQMKKVSIVHHSRKSILYSKERPWVKKEGLGLFDVAMGSYDVAEICDLIGIFALSQLPEQYDRRDIGLYRDDGLVVFRGISGSLADRIKKDFTRSFDQLGLGITIQTNIRSVNFLNVMFNLRVVKYYPYLEPNNKPLYINRLSNHPPLILRQLTAALSRRLTDLSYDADVFREAAPLYNNAL